MPKRPPARQPKHQLVLSLSPRWLHVVHWRRGWLGWTRQHAQALAIPADADFSAQVLSLLRHCTRPWSLPAGTRAHWVLAPDVLGVIGLPDAATSPGGPAAALPFSPTDTITQPDRFAGPSAAMSMLWIHKGWVAEIERISQACQLELAELFARAQLFQQEAAAQPGDVKVVLETQEGQTFLHGFAANGVLLRSRVVDADAGDDLPSVVQAEVAALVSPGAGDQPAQTTLLVSDALAGRTSGWPGLKRHPLAPSAEADRMERLWRSALEGISVRSTHDDVVQQIRVLTLGIGAAGAATLALMLWHDGMLEQQIEQDRASLRAGLPQAEAATALRTRSMQMADAVQAAGAIRDNTAAMNGIAQIVTNFPPPPATLLYARSDMQSLAFAGSGSAGSVQWLRSRPWPGYGPLNDLAVPDFLAQAKPAIHLQASRLPAAPATPAGAKP